MDQSLFKGTLNQKKMEITWNLYYANASLPLVGRPCQKIQQRNALLPLSSSLNFNLMMIWGFWREKKARETYSDQKRHLFPIFRTNGVTRQSAHSSGGKLNYIFCPFQEKPIRKIKQFEAS